MAEFAAAYLLTWATFGVVALAIAARVPATGQVSVGRLVREVDVDAVHQPGVAFRSDVL